MKHMTQAILPSSLSHMAKKAEQYARTSGSHGNFFEEMGFYYVGPVDGHSMRHLVPILQNITSNDAFKRPILLHVVTEKGKGCSATYSCREKWHAVPQCRFDPDTGMLLTPEKTSQSHIPTYTEVFSNTLLQIAERDSRVVGITAAMPSGTGLDALAERFPERYFDVGIAEQHAVTFAAGMAVDGMVPFVAIYSTFLQRAYDQLVHDVAIQKLPVRFMVDRAGYVGQDGPTHAGSFDLGFCASLPGMVVMAASDDASLVSMMATAHAWDEGPSVVRFPRGRALGMRLPDPFQPLTIGQGMIVREAAPYLPARVAILSLGTRLRDACLAAARAEEQWNIGVTVADARFVKPLDRALIHQLWMHHELLITVEEGAIGGFGSHVLAELLPMLGRIPHRAIRTLMMPDIFMPHATMEAMYHHAKLDADGILEVIEQWHREHIGTSRDSAVVSSLVAS